MTESVDHGSSAQIKGNADTTFLIAFWAVVLGPPIGALVVTDAIDGLTKPHVIFPYLAMSYIGGGIPALVGGIFSAILYRRSGRLSWLGAYWCGFAGVIVVLGLPPLISGASWRFILTGIPAVGLFGGIPALIARVICGRFMTLRSLEEMSHLQPRLKDAGWALLAIALTSTAGLADVHFREKPAPLPMEDQR
jgi:hypothetical protein